jgi:hypothetical protein
MHRDDLVGLHKGAVSESISLKLSVGVQPNDGVHRTLTAFSIS